MNAWDEYVPDELDGRTRYQLLTSLVVTRPIGWLGTRSAAGRDNLAPFSYFAALPASPMLVGVSIGHRRTGPKDSLANIRETGEFTVNVVDVDHLEAMNASSASVPRTWTSSSSAASRSGRRSRSVPLMLRVRPARSSRGRGPLE